MNVVLTPAQSKDRGILLSLAQAVADHPEDLDKLCDIVLTDSKEPSAWLMMAVEIMRAQLEYLAMGKSIHDLAQELCSADSPECRVVGGSLLWALQNMTVRPRRKRQK